MLRLSRNVVRTAARALCSDALITAHHPHRVMNQRIQGLGKSATLAINEKCDALLAEGRPVFKMGLGQSPFPVPSCVQQALRENAHQKDYLPVMGLQGLQEAVAAYHSTFLGRPVAAEDILVGPGSKELLFIMQMTYYGQLLLPNPSWVSYGPQAQIIGRPVTWLQTYKEDNWALQPEELEKECAAHPDRGRILLLNYPNNPTGTSFSPSQLQALAEVARKYKVLVLSDEIYGEVTHRYGAHHSISEYYPEGTIVSGGISKWAGAGGWRLGVYNFPQSLHWLRDAMAVVASESFTSVSAPIQHAAIRAYANDAEMQTYLRGSCRVLELIGHHATECLSAAGLDVVRVTGGFYIFPDFEPFKSKLAQRGIRTSPDLAAALLDATGVAVLPGVNFGRPMTELTLRFAFVNFDGETALEAIKDVPDSVEPGSAQAEQFLQRQCPGVVEAFAAVAQWVESL